MCQVLKLLKHHQMHIFNKIKDYSNDDEIKKGLPKMVAFILL